MKPKAFISYSWTSKAHLETVRNWADRLLADGVEVVLDQYDLKEGHDKFAFMEQMVTDPSVSHVLVVSDKAYADKADARKAGVGTESQIISQEVYNKVEQSKFIPILCELSDTGEPYLPVFIKSRIGVNFSTPELVNENWEQLIRLLFGKPLYQKPSVGKPPTYISQNQSSPSNPAISKFASFKQAFLQGKKGIASYREDFLEECFAYTDRLRTRQPPQENAFGEKVLTVCGELVPIRNLLIDWLLLEANPQNRDQFDDVLSAVIEKLIELKSRPKELTSYNDVWFEAHSLFVYETFLYLLAVLLKSGDFITIHGVLNSNYLKPETEIHNTNDRFVNFGACFALAQALQLVPPNGGRYLSPAAELIKRQATRTDLPFASIQEADLVALLVAIIRGSTKWFPQTAFYSGYGKAFPIFVRATQHKHFKKLAIITGVQTGEELRTKVKAGLERTNVESWFDYKLHGNSSFWELMNMDKIDTLS
jgi:hypothetical protein